MLCAAKLCPHSYQQGCRCFSFALAFAAHVLTPPSPKCRCLRAKGCDVRRDTCLRQFGASARGKKMNHWMLLDTFAARSAKRSQRLCISLRRAVHRPRKGDETLTFRCCDETSHGLLACACKAVTSTAVLSGAGCPHLLYRVFQKDLNDLNLVYFTY